MKQVLAPGDLADRDAARADRSAVEVDGTGAAPAKAAAVARAVQAELVAQHREQRRLRGSHHLVRPPVDDKFKAVCLHPDFISPFDHQSISTNAGAW